MVAADGSGGAIVAWQDSRSNVDDDVYAQGIGGDGSTTTGVGPSRPPSNLVVGPGYPNPFTHEAFFDVTLDQESAVSVDVFDVAGRKVRSIDMKSIPTGATRLTFDGLDDRARALPSGVYFYRVHAGGESMTRKMVIAR